MHEKDSRSQSFAMIDFYSERVKHTRRTYYMVKAMISSEGGICPTLNLSDTEVLRQIRVSLGWVLSDNFRVGQFPASPTVIGRNKFFPLFF